MDSNELRKAIADKVIEGRSLLKSKKVDEAEKVVEEKRALEKELRVTEALEDDEKRSLENQREHQEPEHRDGETQEEKELRTFVNYIRGEKRTLTKGSNGDLVPTTISNMIIKKLKTISPIYSQVKVVPMKGKLVLVSSTAGTASYITESSTAGTGTEPTFTPVTLEDFVIKAKAKVSNQLINNTDFDIVSEVVSLVAEAISNFVEKEILTGAGSTSAINGLVNGTNKVELESTTTAVSTDNLIELEMAVKQAYRAGGNFYMHTNTLLALRKLKDQNGAYILQPAINGAYNYTLLGRPVYESESMDEFGKGKKPIIFANPAQAYTFKHSKTLEVKVLDELYADDYQTGILAFLDADGDITNNDASAVLSVKAS